MSEVTSIKKHWIHRVRWRSHLATLAMVLVALLAAHFWQTRNVPGGPAPDFSALAVSTQDGAVLSLAQWRAAHPGQPVALHFWAEWCPICKLEEHSISRVSRDWPVLTVAMQSGDVAAVRRVLAQRMLDEGYLLAPGALFHASRQPCTLMRINFTTTQDAAFWRVLQRVVAQSR